MTADDEILRTTTRLWATIREQQREIEQLKASRRPRPSARGGFLARRRSALSVSIALMLALVVGGIAYADIPDTGVVHGCAVLIKSVKQYTLRVVDTSAGQTCAAGQVPVDWLPATNAVDRSTDQTIGGNKTFAGVVAVSNAGTGGTGIRLVNQTSGGKEWDLVSFPSGEFGLNDANDHFTPLVVGAQGATVRGELQAVNNDTGTVANLSSSNSSGTQVHLTNTSSGGKHWMLVSSGSGDTVEGAGKVLLRDATDSVTPLTVSTDGISVNGSGSGVLDRALTATSANSSGTALSLANTSSGGHEIDLVSNGSTGFGWTDSYPPGSLVITDKTAQTDLLTLNTTLAEIPWASLEVDHGDLAIINGNLYMGKRPAIANDGTMYPTTLEFPDHSQMTSAPQIHQYRQQFNISGLTLGEGTVSCPSGQWLISGGTEVLDTVRNMNLEASSPDPASTYQATQAWRAVYNNVSTSGHSFWVWAICSGELPVHGPGSVCEANCTASVAKASVAKAAAGATIRRWTRRDGVRVMLETQPLKQH